MRARKSKPTQLAASSSLITCSRCRSTSRRAATSQINRHSAAQPRHSTSQILQVRRLAAFFRGTFDPTLTLEGSMLSHKFHTGQLVQLIPSISRNVPGGSFEITKKLPEHDGEYEYRIKSMNEAHERVARESELRGV
jgi:hypothetical protein